jgi:MoxR-like ATPase
LRWLEPVVDVDDVRALRDAVTTVYVDPLLQRWIVELVRSTRELDEVAVGASVRGSLALERAARAWALLDHRGYVVPEDIDRLFSPVLLHRIVFRPTFLAEARRVGWDEAVAGVERKCFTAAPRPEPEPAEDSPAPEPMPVAHDQH